VALAVVGVNRIAVLPFALFVHVFSPRLADGTIELREVEVKRLILLIALVVIPAGLPVLVMSGYRLE
jgi:hypothetical protein